VSTAALDKDLEAVGLVMSRKNKPRTMLLLMEQNVGMDGPAVPWSGARRVGYDLRIGENVMLDELQKKGFKVVDPDIAADKAAKQFKNALTQRVRGVKDVNQRSFGGGKAELEVTLVGSTEQFADEIESKKLGNFSVTVKGYSANTVDVELGE